MIWARRNLAIISDFEPIGPRLPIEFCRVSRDGSLTLVIEEAFGAPCINILSYECFRQSR